MARKAIFSVCLALAGTAMAQDASDAEKRLVNTLMQRSILVPVTDVGSADAFVPDNDPETLQIVFLTGPQAGTPHVSEDGEVVFAYLDMPIHEQSALTRLAFERKARRLLRKT